MRYIRIYMASALTAAALAQTATAQAQTAAGRTDNKTSEGLFTLGQITVTGHQEADATGDDRVTAEEVWQFNLNTLTEAVKLVPGVSSTFVTNGRRNEGDISVRGFDRWRVPLSIDGIRIYLPADNRLDFNRFLTPDLGEIQIRKGYVSVLDGPGGMGGAINLVTRKPTKEFEAEFQGGASFDRDGSYEGWTGSALVGTRQEKWYLQGSATQLKREHWTLSNDFTPISAAEDGGERNGSYNRDWRVNVKAGFTPNDTDEYSLSFTKQSGDKGAPLNVNLFPPNPGNSYWTWPYWDVRSVYWLSQTNFSDSSYVKTRLFYNEFENALFAWDDITYSAQSANGRFRSYYDDDSFGGSIEAGTSFVERNVTRAAVHWRRDRHVEYNHNRPTHPTLSSTEPKQHNEERTWSVALENTYSATDAVDVVAGISYDSNDLKQAQEYNTTDGLYEYPLGGSHAWNWQGGVQWRYADNAQLGASVSSRTRFPNNFERFSTRFGTAVPNPDLATERAINYEINWKADLSASTQVTASVFYNDVRDMIQTVIVQTLPQLTQTQNVGDGEFYGLELAGDWRVSGQLRVGANYSYLRRKIEDPLQPNLRPVGVPDHLGFAYLSWQPIAAFTVQPSVEAAGKRWTDVTGSTTYQRIGEYTLVNLQLQYQPVPSVDIVIGGRNLFDRNFELAWGFPEPGRTLFTKFRVNF